MSVCSRSQSSPVRGGFELSKLGRIVWGKNIGIEERIGLKSDVFECGRLVSMHNKGPIVILIQQCTLLQCTPLFVFCVTCGPLIVEVKCIEN